MFIRDYRDWFFLCVKNWKYVKKIWIIKFIRPVRKIGTLEYPFIREYLTLNAQLKIQTINGAYKIPQEKIWVSNR